MEQEADLQVTGSWETGLSAIGEKLEHHGRSIIWDTVEISVGHCQVCKTEVGKERCVGTKLDAHLGSTVGIDSVVQELENLACKLHSWHCTGISRFGSVVCKTEFVTVG